MTSQTLFAYLWPFINPHEKAPLEQLIPLEQFFNQQTTVRPPPILFDFHYIIEKKLDAHALEYFFRCKYRAKKNQLTQAFHVLIYFMETSGDYVSKFNNNRQQLLAFFFLVFETLLAPLLYLKGQLIVYLHPQLLLRESKSVESPSALET